MNLKLKEFSIHSCPLSPWCRKYDDEPPWRFHINTPWWHFAFALRPGARFVRIKDYYSGKPEEEWEYISEWTMFKRRQEP